jgi:signal transduction histidine kinase
MFFGGNNGFISFFPDDIRDNPHVPPVVINKITVFTQGEKGGRLVTEAARPVDLEYTQNTFSFEFAALDYAMSERNRYAIMLEGFERDWRYLAAGEHSEMYTNLDPGEYTLRVKGSNGDGVWNNDGAAVRIMIHPPYWMTWYFRTGAACFALLLVGSLFTYRIKTIARRNLELERKVQERTSELHQSNEELNRYKQTLEEQVKERTLALERTVMTLQAEVTSRERIQRELISYQKDLQQLASDLSRSEERERRRIAAFLHDVVGQTLFFCKMKLGSLKEDAGTADLAHVHGLVEDLLNQVQSLTFDLSPPVLYELGLDEAIMWLIEQRSKSQEAEIVYHRGELPERLSDEARFVVFTAARELLTNALKHSGARHIAIFLGEREPGHIRLAVEDDGRGFDPDSVIGRAAGRKGAPGGFGLFNVRERLSFLGGTVRIESAPGRGSTVELVLPLNGQA